MKAAKAARARLVFDHAALPVFGTVRIAASAQGVCAIALPDWHDPELWLAHWPGAALEAGSSPLLARAFKELAAYATGRRKRFTVAIDLGALPEFTVRVLSTLHGLGYGALTNYGQLAHAAGSPRAARAVGQAVGRNPLPVIIPCHRVIAADGTIGGFGLGLAAKRRLLAIEGLSVPDARRS